MAVTLAPLAPHIPHVHGYMHTRMHASIHAKCAPAHRRGLASLLTPVLAAQAPLASYRHPRLKHDKCRCGGDDGDGVYGRGNSHAKPRRLAAAACAAWQSLGLP